VSRLRRISTQNGRGGFILNATLNRNAPEYTVGIGTGLTGRLLHAVAELLVPILPKVLPSAKIELVRLSLILKSDHIPSLQTLGEIPLDNLDEDVIFVIRGANRASGTTSPGLAIGVHGARISWKIIFWTRLNLDRLAGQPI
jgi:hypothetical protein